MFLTVNTRCRFSYRCYIIYNGRYSCWDLLSQRLLLGVGVVVCEILVLIDDRFGCWSFCAHNSLQCWCLLNNCWWSVAVHQRSWLGVRRGRYIYSQCGSTHSWLNVSCTSTGLGFSGTAHIRAESQTLL